ncbi:MAG TPA: hypothetical protein VFP84_02555 [Kofleriaceae bacterium]|nr:hypothetical protein [Kofleriaceae bacterium]
MRRCPTATIATIATIATSLAAGPALGEPAASESSAAPAPAPAPAGGLEARIAKLEAELAQLKAASDADLVSATTTSEAEASDKEPMFRLYGFIDMGVQKLWAADDVALPTTKTTFVLGNINLYFDFHPAAEWSSLVEARLTNAPSDDERPGIPQFGQPYARFDNTAPDPGNGDGYDAVRWGAIVLERAYIQWQRWAQLGVRVGQFLTPYGIWNVDHGTPTLISLFRPKAQSNQMFPEHQLGVEAFGRFDLPARWQLEWHGYVSNGRTPGTVALTENKMLGGRAVLSTTRPYAMAFGVSGMHGTYLDAQHNANAVTGAPERPAIVRYDEWAAGVDASLDLGPLRLRGEGALRHKDYRDGARDAWYPGVYVADGFEVDAYMLAAYRIPHTRFEPYLYSEYYYWPTPIGDRLLNASVGLNTYFTPAIQLKIELSRVDWLETTAVGGKASPDETFLAGKLVMGF